MNIFGIFNRKRGEVKSQMSSLNNEKLLHEHWRKEYGADFWAGPFSGISREAHVQETSK